MDLSSWLRDLGLEQYEAAFRDNAVDLAVLPELTADDLKDIGVVAVGHRRKLLSAIAALAEGCRKRNDVQSTVALPAPDLAAERRQLTVLFCDLVGSTELSGRLEAEDFRNLIASFQQMCAAAIARFEGYVAKYMGDGLLAYFGYPTAHEDDASRAVRAGLALVQDVASLELPTGVERLRVRVGIATGLAVVGDLIGSGSAQEQSVAGETPNLAARLQAHATPGSVVIAETTRRLVGAEFELEDLGPTALKGFAEPVPAFRVIRPRALQTRFDARGIGAGQLVGRHEEVGLLLRRWEQAREGEGQAVLLSGEAGIGKSRVTRGLLGHIGSEPHLAIQLQCSPLFANTALHPFLAYLEHAAGLQAHESPDEKLDKLEALLRRARHPVERGAPFLAALLAIPTQSRYAGLEYDARRQNELTVEAITEYLVALSRLEPLLVLVEDLHWADPTTLQLIEQLIARAETCRVLALLTFRAEFVPSWRARPQVTSITLNRLSRRQSMDFINGLSREAIDEATVEQLLARADGVPLYLEELTKGVLEAREQGGNTGSSSRIPSTLQDSLMSRLDRYPGAKRVAQCAAVIGREYSYGLLASISDEKEPELQKSLEQLVSAELVFARGTPPDASYTFKHALVRDAAYESLLKSRRQELHARVAQALRKDALLAARQPELLAYHLGEARLPEEAVVFWKRAADQAAARHAQQEAIAHSARGIETARRIGNQAIADQHELRLQVRLGNSAIAAKGWAVPEVGQAFYRARELCARLGDDTLLHSILVGLFYFHSFQAELHKAEELGLELLALGERNTDRVLQVFGHELLVDARYKLAKFAAAREHLELGTALYEQAPWPEIADEHLGDPRTNLLIYGSVVWWVLGYPERAKRTARDAIALARSGGHRLSIAHTIYMAGHLAELAADWEEVQKANDETAALADEWGLMGLRQQVARRDRLVAVVLRNDPEEIAYKRANPQPGFARSLHEAVLAQALGRTGELEEAVRVVEGAIRWSEATSSLFFHAELHRIWAELLLQLDRRDEAERVLAVAVEIARQQGAKMWELRASYDLARLWKEVGRSQQAHELLHPLVQSFDETSPEVDASRRLVVSLEAQQLHSST